VDVFQLQFQIHLFHQLVHPQYYAQQDLNLMEKEIALNHLFQMFVLLDLAVMEMEIV
jgi:hypothetical protein